MRKCGRNTVCKGLLPPGGKKIVSKREKSVTKECGSDGDLHISQQVWLGRQVVVLRRLESNVSDQYMFITSPENCCGCGKLSIARTVKDYVFLTLMKAWTNLKRSCGKVMLVEASSLFHSKICNHCFRGRSKTTIPYVFTILRMCTIPAVITIPYIITILHVITILYLIIPYLIAILYTIIIPYVITIQ